jgi:hypothetical protein
MREETASGATIERELRGDVVVLRMSGQMREVGADALRDELDELLEEGRYMLIFDMSDISFISSVGLGQNPQPLVEEVFRFTKLHTLIGIFPTVEEAIQAE